MKARLAYNSGRLAHKPPADIPHPEAVGGADRAAALKKAMVEQTKPTVPVVKKIAADAVSGGSNG